MGRPKKQIRKRDRIFNFMDRAIDLVKDKWRTSIKATIALVIASMFIYVVFFWIDTVAEIKFEIIYI